MKHAKRITVILIAIALILAICPFNFSGATQDVITAKVQKHDKVSSVGIVRSSKKKAKQLKYKDIKKMVNDAIDQAGGFNELISDGMTVILKPNLVYDKTYLSPDNYMDAEVNGCTTDWRVTKAVAERVRKLNPNGKVYVMEGASQPTDSMFFSLGYTKDNFPMVDEFYALESPSISGGVLDYESDKLVKVQLPSNIQKLDTQDCYYYNKIYYNADVMISIPVLKNHWHAVVTGGIKNLGIGGTPATIYGSNNGIDAGRDQSKIPHDRNLHNWISDYYTGRPADYVVMDGLQSVDKGPTPMGGGKLSDFQKNLRIILAGADAVATDTVESLIMKWEPYSVNYLKYLNQNKVGNGNVENITVNGVQVDEINKKLTYRPHTGSGYYQGGGKQFTDTKGPSVKIKKAKAKKQVLNLKLKVASDTKKVEFLINGKKIGSPVSSGYANIKLDISSVKKGNNKVTVWAFDKFLNRKTAVKSFKKTVAPSKPSKVKPSSYGKNNAAFAETAVVVDGKANDSVWKKVVWSPIKTNWLDDKKVDAKDFSGKFKFAWTKNRLYFLAEITDDKLIKPADGIIDNYSDYDCLELFVDEDKSGGEHTFSHNAFAYHMTLNGNVCDLSATSKDYTPVLLNDNIKYTMVDNGNGTYTWEGSVKIFDDTFVEGNTSNVPLKLFAGKKMGVSLAYCDNDEDDKKRDHFFGSNETPGLGKNVAWQNADAFGLLTLVK